MTARLTPDQLLDRSMTTSAETLAPHFAAIAHQLGRIADALESGNAAGKVSPTPPGTADAPEDDSRPRDEFGPLYCWCGARTSKRMVSRRMARYCMKGHDPEHPPTPAPMTVGQLTAEQLNSQSRGHSVTVNIVDTVTTMVYVVPEPGPPDPEFAAQLVRARKRAMLTQKELAEKMRDAGHSWHQNTVSRIENAVQHVTIKELVSLQEITGADPSLTASHRSQGARHPYRED